MPAPPPRGVWPAGPRGSGRPLFRNPQEKRWLKPTGGDHFRQIKQTFDWDRDPLRATYFCYTCRQTFTHQMLFGY